MKKHKLITKCVQIGLGFQIRKHLIQSREELRNLFVEHDIGTDKRDLHQPLDELLRSLLCIEVHLDHSDAVDNNNNT